MQYISAEEFLEQSENIQKSFLDWWQPEVGDIYCNLYNGQENNVLVINECQLAFKSFTNDIKKYGVPLLTEGQLRQFIEDKTKTILLTEFKNCNEYKFLFDILGEDLLHAYWKVACEIAKEN